jgi:hypothetical protein
VSFSFGVFSKTLSLKLSAVAVVTTPLSFGLVADFGTLFSLTIVLEPITFSYSSTKEILEFVSVNTERIFVFVFAPSRSTPLSSAYALS